MDRTAPARFPLWMVLLLLICLSGMAVHFYVESLDFPGQHASPAHNESAGHCDDHFIQLTPAMFPMHNLVAVLTTETALPRASLGVLPLLPPPNS
jgi:hypothetical protein